MNQKTFKIDWIRERISKNEYLFTLHADEERRNDLLNISDIEKAILNGVILEEYQEDKRGPSCLVGGYFEDKPIHVVCGQNKSEWLVIVTVYIPTSPRWKTPTERRGNV